MIYPVDSAIQRLNNRGQIAGLGAFLSLVFIGWAFNARDTPLEKQLTNIIPKRLSDWLSGYLSFKLVGYQVIQVINKA